MCIRDRLKALDKGTRLVLIGDCDQLPSVQAGNVFADLIGSQVFPVTYLTKTFRQKQGSAILTNASCVNRGRGRFLWNTDCMLCQTWQEEDTLDGLLQVIRALQKQGISSKAMQVLTPFRSKTKLGCIQLNRVLQELMNPKTAGTVELLVGSRCFRKEMCIRDRVLIGDCDQLPSVQAGNVFADLIGSQVFPVTYLTKTFRQKQGSAILTNASCVNRGRGRFLWNTDCMLCQTWQEEDTLDGLLQVIRALQKQGISSKAMQVLTPFRSKTKLGCIQLNRVLQELMNPKTAGTVELLVGSRCFRKGDKVMHLENEEDVSNGDVGYITEINQTERKLTILYETGVERTYTLSLIHICSFESANFCRFSASTNAASILSFVNFCFTGNRCTLQKVSQPKNC